MRYIEGTAIATILSFGCHPVLLGCRCGDHAYADHKSHFFQVSSDFVGALRLSVERGEGRVSFPPGAAGNVLPLETFNDGGEDPNEHSAGAWASNQFTQLQTDRPWLRTSSASAMTT